MCREEWLRHAVEFLDTELFGGGLELLNNTYQISCGRTKKNKLTEVVFPYDGADVQLDDLFPNTIYVNDSFKDSVEMLSNLAYSCIQCFYGIRSVKNKQFKTLAESFYFDSPYNQCHPSSHLTDIIKNIYNKMVVKYGEFPGKAVVVRKKEKSEKGKGRTIKMFCAECGYEMKTTRKMFEKHGEKLPTCVCGAKMALDLSDEEQENNQ